MNTIVLKKLMTISLCTLFIWCNGLLANAASKEPEVDIHKLVNGLYNAVWSGDKKKIYDFTSKNIIYISIILDKLKQEAPEQSEMRDAVEYVRNAVFNANPLMALGEGVPPQETKDINKHVMLVLANPYFKWHELSYQEFMAVLSVISKLPKFMGISNLVQFNKKNIGRFVKEAVNEELAQGSLYHEITCELAFLYRNHFHKKDLLRLIDEKVGGVKEYLARRNELGISIAEGNPFSFFNKEKAAIVKMILEGEYDESLKYLKSQFVITDIVYSGQNLSFSNVYPDIVLLYAVMSMRNEDYFTADFLIDYLMKRNYTDALLIADSKFKENIRLIDNVFLEYKKGNVEDFTIYDLLKSITGKDYSSLRYDLWAYSNNARSAKCDNEWEKSGAALFKRLKTLQSDTIPLKATKGFVNYVASQCREKAQQGHQLGR